MALRPRRGDYMTVRAQDQVGEQARAAVAAGRTALDEVESKRLLRTIGVPVTDPVVAGSADDAAAAAERLGYPVALKVVSAQILHKTKAGGVILGVCDANGVRQAFDAIRDNVRSTQPDAEISGVAIEAMDRPGLEVITGLQRDPTFGAVVVFGLGGTLVELIDDVAMRVMPFERSDAEAMVGEIRGARLLHGYRDQPPRDVAALVDLILALRTLATMEIESVDLNPVHVHGTGEGVLVLDASVVLAGGGAAGD
jgi:acetate---CoA ligase (ADP-forming)